MKSYKLGTLFCTIGGALIGFSIPPPFYPFILSLGIAFFIVGLFIKD